MLRKIIHTILVRRHFWRYATYSEVAELYAARLLRILALRMVTLFIAIFLYNKGYSLVFILTYLAVQYFGKALLAFVAGFLVARNGPKRTTLHANLLYIPALVAFTFVDSADSAHGLIALGFVAFFQSLSSVLYDYSYLVNFSKVKSVKHAGKELGYMQVVEKIAGVLSPVVGGIIASVFGQTTVLIIAAILFAVAALPLLRTGEPTKIRQKIRWKGFPWRISWRSIVAENGIGVDYAASGVLWSLFLAASVFAYQGEGVYVTVGILTALSTAMAFISAFIFGRLIDRKSGGLLIKYGVIFKAIGHVMRPVTAGPVEAAAVGSLTEVSTTAYAMAFMRGMFDVADVSGFRLTYMLLIEIAVNIGASSAYAAAAVLFYVFDQTFAFTLVFMGAALYTLVIATPRFQIYRR
jgi:MFS family permease